MIVYQVGSGTLMFTTLEQLTLTWTCADVLRLFCVRPIHSCPCWWYCGSNIYQSGWHWEPTQHWFSFIWGTRWEKKGTFTHPSMCSSLHDYNHVLLFVGGGAPITTAQQVKPKSPTHKPSMMTPCCCLVQYDTSWHHVHVVWLWYRMRLKLHGLNVYILVYLYIIVLQHLYQHILWMVTICAALCVADMLCLW